MVFDSTERIDGDGVAGTVVKNESCARGSRFGRRVRATDASGKVCGIDYGIGTDFDDGVGGGFEGAVAGRGFGEVAGVAGCGGREGEFEVGGGGGVW